MTIQIKRNAIVAAVTAGLLVLATASPAAAWGGPFSFSYGSSTCAKKSAATNTAGNANAFTTLSLGSGPVKVGFRGGGHYWINPVSGAGTAISYISQSVVNTYGVTGATHQCATSGNSYT
jgi:hypothetical protein